LPYGRAPWTCASHINRSELDERGGAFTGLKLTIIEGRIKQEAAAALAALRDELEGAQ